LQFLILLFDLHSAFLDNVEGVGIIALVKYDLFLFVCLSEAAASDGILLVLGQVLEKRKNFQKFFVLLLIDLVDIVHDFLEGRAADDCQLAVCYSEHRSRTRSIINNSQIPKGISVS